jgi:hypothetical protein
MQFLKLVEHIEGDLIDKIYALEELNKPDNVENPITPPLNHHHCDGLYGREIFLPKGTIATGRVHLKDHISVISQGKVTVVTPDEIVTYESPITFTAKKGCKRCLYVHEDTIWTTIHLAESKELKELEADLTTNDKNICRELNTLTLEGAK